MWHARHVYIVKKNQGLLFPGWIVGRQPGRQEKCCLIHYSLFLVDMVNRDWLKTSVQNIYGSPSLACRWTNTGCKPAIMTTRKNTSALHPIPTLVTVAHLWPNNRIDLPYTRALNTHARYGKGGWGVWLKTDLVMTMSNEVQGEHEWRSDSSKPTAEF